MNNKCDIILPVCDQYEFTKNCIDSIVKHTDTPFRLIIINNGTNPRTRGLLDGLEKDDSVETTIVHNGRNIGWVKALNKGMELSDAPFLCFQNDDTIVTRGWLRKMTATLSLSPEFGLINPSWEGRTANVSIDAYNDRLEKSGKRYIETDWCRGFSVVLKREVMKKIGKVDEIYGLAYFDDVDYSVTAIEAGFRCLLALDTYVYHHRNVTFFEILKGPKWNELHEKNKIIYYNKWGRPLKFFVCVNRTSAGGKKSAARVAEAVYRLARKQHRVYLWCRDGELASSVIHTNVIVRKCPAPFRRAAVMADIILNKKRRHGKRYDAAFTDDRSLAAAFGGDGGEGVKFYVDESDDFCEFMVREADALKESTKGKNS